MRFIIFVSIILFLNSCYDEINFDFPDPEQKIVINGVLKIDSCFRVSVSRSFSEGMNSDLNYVYLDDAEVLLYANNTFQEKLQLEDWGHYRSDQNNKPKYNSEYSIKVYHPLFDSCYSSTTIPEKPKMELINYRMDTAKPSWENTHTHVFRVSIDDNTNTNFYLLRFLKNHSKLFINNDCIKLDDPLFSQRSESTYSAIYDYYFVFNDNSFNGSKKELEIFIEDNGSQKIIIELHSITEDLYKYFVTHNNFILVNPHASHGIINPYSNIENGLGIFGAANIHRIEYDVPQKP